MATKNIFLAFAACMLITLACGGGQLTPNLQATVNAAVQGTQEAQPNSTLTNELNTPISQLPNESPTPVQEASPCEVDKWKIIPTSIFTDPTGEEGWKYVLVRLAFENSSPYWGKVMINPKMAIIASENGFQYSALDWEYRWVSNVEPFTDRVDSILIDFGLLPPSFVATGTPRTIGVGSGYTQAIFRVAASQKSFRLTLPSGNLTCIRDSTNTYDIFPSKTLNLDNEINTPSYPTSAYEDLQTFKEPIVLPNLGTLNFVGYKKEAIFGYFETLLKLQFQFTNASSGYDANLDIRGYFIGNDGLARSFFSTFDDCYQDTVGPGLTKELDICTFIDDELTDVILVLTQPVMAVFKLEGIPSLIPLTDGQWEGTFNKPGYSPFTISLNLTDCQLGTLCGTIDYPDLACGGTITYLGTRGSRYRLQEKITYGNTYNCGEESIIEIEPAVGDEWKASWYNINSSHIRLGLEDVILIKLK